MASPREIKKRIGSVTNTKKITRTMELVSTAKAKKAVDRVSAAQPFAQKLGELIGSLSGDETAKMHPLLRTIANPRTIVLIGITASRGLCGAFNSNVIKATLDRRKKLLDSGVEVSTILIGKKIESFFKFQAIEYDRAITTIDDKPVFDDTLELANELMDSFISGKIDGVEVISTRYISSSAQRVERHGLLPLSIEADEEQDESPNPQGPTIFEPGSKQILSELLPRSVRIALYQSVLESAASEQIARRIAMKNATDAASDMIKSMTLIYNRARQGKITQEIAEIVGGAAAIE
jgi:F-type H+-transporting ATPase subunit gamma